LEDSQHTTQNLTHRISRTRKKSGLEDTTVDLTIKDKHGIHHCTLTRRVNHILHPEKAWRVMQDLIKMRVDGGVLKPYPAADSAPAPAPASSPGLLPPCLLVPPLNSGRGGTRLPTGSPCLPRLLMPSLLCYHLSSLLASAMCCHLQCAATYSIVCHPLASLCWPTKRESCPARNLTFNHLL
jgi:hypothetical protein